MDEENKVPFGIPDSFFGNARAGNKEGLIILTIPKDFCDGIKLQAGDKVKVWVKKVIEGKND